MYSQAHIDRESWMQRKMNNEIVKIMGKACKQGINTFKVYIGFRDQIFPFSENWPANYNFSLFSKLPTNYPKTNKIIQKTFFGILLDFFGNYLVTLNKVKNYNLQANFQRMEKSGL